MRECRHHYQSSVAAAAALVAVTQKDERESRWSRVEHISLTLDTTTTLLMMSRDLIAF